MAVGYAIDREGYDLTPGARVDPVANGIRVHRCERLVVRGWPIVEPGGIGGSWWTGLADVERRDARRPRPGGSRVPPGRRERRLDVSGRLRVASGGTEPVRTGFERVGRLFRPAGSAGGREHRPATDDLVVRGRGQLGGKQAHSGGCRHSGETQAVVRIGDTIVGAGFAAEDPEMGEHVAGVWVSNDAGATWDQVPPFTSTVRVIDIFGLVSTPEGLVAEGWSTTGTTPTRSEGAYGLRSTTAPPGRRYPMKRDLLTDAATGVHLGSSQRHGCGYRLRLRGRSDVDRRVERLK